MIETPDIVRPSRELIEGLAHIGSATSSGELARLGYGILTSAAPSPGVQERASWVLLSPCSLCPSARTSTVLENT